MSLSCFSILCYLTLAVFTHHETTAVLQNATLSYPETVKLTIIHMTDVCLCFCLFCFVCCFFPEWSTSEGMFQSQRLTDQLKFICGLKFVLGSWTQTLESQLRSYKPKTSRQFHNVIMITLNSLINS